MTRNLVTWSLLILFFKLQVTLQLLTTSALGKYASTWFISYFL